MLSIINHDFIKKGIKSFSNFFDSKKTKNFYLKLKKVEILNVHYIVDEKYEKLLKEKKMNKEQATKIVIKAISDILKGKSGISEDMQLIGGESLLDSVNLVEACLLLEDVADEYGFEFDWTSEAAMSRSRSMFRSVSSLAEEFANQSEA